MAQFSKPGLVLYNDRPALYVTSGTFDAESGDTEVKTLALGLAGYSDGAQMCKLDTESAIPQAGAEIDWCAISLAHLDIDIGFRMAGKTYQCRGRVLRASIKTTPDSNNAYSMSFAGYVLGIISGT